MGQFYCTSGAIQKGVPTEVFLLRRVFVSWAETPAGRRTHTSDIFARFQDGSSVETICNNFLGVLLFPHKDQTGWLKWWSVKRETVNSKQRDAVRLIRGWMDLRAFSRPTDKAVTIVTRRRKKQNTHVYTLTSTQRHQAAVCLQMIDCFELQILMWLQVIFPGISRTTFEYNSTVNRLWQLETTLFPLSEQDIMYPSDLLAHVSFYLPVWKEDKVMLQQSVRDRYIQQQWRKWGNVHGHWFTPVWWKSLIIIRNLINLNKLN